MTTKREITQKTWVAIDLAALRGNLRAMSATIGPERSIILVVKSDAYGHGARSVVDAAADVGIAHFAVATVDEGEALRRFNVTGEILLLHPPLAFEMERTIAANLTPTISDERTARQFNDLLSGARRPVHVEVNTGMNRLGVNWQDAAETIARISRLPHLTIGGVFTHSRTAMPTDADAVHEQISRFREVLADCTARGIDPGVCHAASSYVLAYHPETLCDAVRPGLLAYGGLVIDAARAVDPTLTAIKPVMSVHTRVLHLRDVGAGEWIHYGDAFRAERPMRVAVLPIGYGMGYSRHLTNKAQVLIDGHRAPVVGTVGMDMTVVDLAGIDGVSVGEPVTILGRDGDDAITAEELARWAGTIPYEITCRLGNGLPRCVVGAEVPAAGLTATTAGR
ncbi:MAG TPA: alanine racemase [Acidobacteriota bacterium]|nr:alanine racemase [Acidobacteriota bacterium]